MTDFWQHALVFGIVAAAAFYLLNRIMPKHRKSAASGCESGCSSCPNSKSETTTLVDLTLPSKS